VAPVKKLRARRTNDPLANLEMNTARGRRLCHWGAGLVSIADATAHGRRSPAGLVAAMTHKYSHFLFIRR
jgi:hypothetical protein